MPPPTPPPILSGVCCVHIVPTRDAKDHEVKWDKPCWCGPTVQVEDVMDGSGETNTVYIHQPVLPFVPGHNLDIQKIILMKHDGKETAMRLRER